MKFELGHFSPGQLALGLCVAAGALAAGGTAFFLPAAEAG